MSGKARFVFDTNVIVSALFFEQGKPSRAFRQALRDGEILISLATLEELDEVLRREKFNRFLPLEEREEFLRSLVARARFVEPDEVIEACRDPKDDKFLELAVSGRARYLITGDDDLLALNPFRDIAIVNPDQFLAITAEKLPSD